MRIVIIGQEEPIYFGPFFRRIIEEKSSEIECVAIVGNRGIGSHPKTFLEKIKNIYSLWLLFEPFAFFKNLTIKCFQKTLFLFDLLGSRLDKRTIQGLAKKKNIPLIFTNDINSEDFFRQLEPYAPDIIINQSELIIRDKLLSLPKIGILNRHASLLPRFRGRVGSFWAHAEKEPEYGVTIHLVDQKIDSGPIIVQERYHIDPSLAYGTIIDILFQKSVSLMLQALKKLEDPNFSYLPNNFQGTPTYGFPSLKNIRDYRKTLKARRNRWL